MENVYYKAIIIGGGPLGLYFASKLEEHHENYLLIEATSTLGGQIPKFYPHKPIEDIDEFELIEAQEYINVLIGRVDPNKIILNSEVIDIIECDDHASITTKDGKIYLAKNIILAIGLGFPKSKSLGLEGEEKYNNILYSLHDYEFMRGKKVAIFGGGDSALDWAKNLSDIADNVSLVHRRDELRGDGSKIANKKIDLYLSYVPIKLIDENNECVGITIASVKNNQDTKNLLVDYILVNFGTVPSVTPFSFDRDTAGYKVDQNYKLSKHVFAIGDIASYENKKRRIQPGINEAHVVLKELN